MLSRGSFFYWKNYNKSGDLYNRTGGFFVRLFHKSIFQWYASEKGGSNMSAYVYPIKINGQEILIVHDDKLVTWLNATDLVVRAGLYWFIEKHPEAGIIDLLNFCVEQEFECGLVFDGSDAALHTGQSS